MGILVVEDNYLVGEMMRLAVEEAEFDVVGPVATMEEGIKRADLPSLKGALLDINLRGRHSFPLARILKSKGVPILFVSGYGRSLLPADLQDELLLGKPILGADLARITRDHFKSNAGASGEKKLIHTRAEVLSQR